MKVVLMTVFSFLIGLTQGFSQTDSLSKKAIFILVDGIALDMIEDTETPYIDAIAKIGGFSAAFQGGIKGCYNETPTISAPGYMNLITGVWANKHNVWGNSMVKPKYSNSLNMFGYMRLQKSLKGKNALVPDNHYPTPNYHYKNIFRIVKENHPHLKTALFSSWIENRLKLIGEEKPEAGNIKLDYAFDGFDEDTIMFPHRNNSYHHIKDVDEHIAEGTASYIRVHAPELSWVYLWYPDVTGHAYGDSPEMSEAIQNVDKQIGQIWQAVKYRENHFDEDWIFVVTTDHGRSPTDGKNHGGQTARERSTWILTNSSQLNQHFEQDTLAVVDILPSVLKHLRITPPEDIRSELDGTSFIGPISIANAQAEYLASDIKLKWKAFGVGKVDILYTSTNHYQSGGTDYYQLIDNVDLQEEHYIIKNFPYQSGTFKFLLKTDNNWINTWLHID